MPMLVLLILGALMIASPGPVAADEAGKAAFIAAKCNDCHSIKAAGIEVKKGEESLEGDDDGDKSPDLSGVGAEHDADWMAQFLKKKVKNDDGKKHKKRFKGSDDKLKELTTYLASLKTPVK